MKHIFLNLKRFDIPKELGGVNAIAPIHQWGSYIVENTQEALKAYEGEDVEFAMYFPEAHLIPAVNALCENSPVQVGCQSVYRDDTAVGGNFGAFTSNRTANAAKAIGCATTIIGHCEERRDKAGVLAEAGVTDTAAVNRLLNQEIKAAVKAGLKVLYCIGESSEEQSRWQEVLREQLETGLEGVDKSMVTIAYEPIWAIGPGKTPPGSGIHNYDWYLCKRSDRRNGCGLRRRSENRQCENAGIDSGNGRRSDCSDPFFRRDRILSGGISGNHPYLHG